jgi:hypothetical protein
MLKEEKRFIDILVASSTGYYISSKSTHLPSTMLLLSHIEKQQQQTPKGNQNRSIDLSMYAHKLG